MENFVAYNPTRLHFGKGVVDNLGKTASALGKKALLVYGKGSVVKNGYYDLVKNQLTSAGLGIAEYHGIKSNPVVEDVNAAAELGIREKADLIVALGGGSVIDASKIISLCIAGRFKGWDVMTREVKPSSKIPLIGILTLAATGTEMNGVAVLQNAVTRQKFGFFHELNYPDHSFLDPEFTYTVPPDYTAYGVADLIAHCLENYFGKAEAPLSDKFIYSIISEAMECGPRLLDEPRDYDCRARIMWAATNALNGLTAYGKGTGDWAVHGIGHTLSFLYDTPHGASLTIAYPAWLKLHKDRIPDRIKQLGKHLFNVNSVDDTIDELKRFFHSIHCPIHLSDIRIHNSKKNEIVQLMEQNNITGQVHELSKDDLKRLVNMMM